MKSIDLSFILNRYPNEPVGIAGPIFSGQIDGSEYIVRMQREGETVIVAAMIRARTESAVEPYIMNLNNDEFAIVRNWLVNFSGFIETPKAELLAAFDAE